MTLRAQRWETCLHEAAHLVVALHWNPDGGGSAFLTREGGYATCPRMASDFREGVVSAAGDCGGRLAKRYACPSEQPARRARAEVTAGAASAEVEAEYRQCCNAGDDVSRIDRIVIELYPGQPREWVRARRRICANARLLVWQHRHRIRELATRLFLDGFIILPAQLPE